MTHDYWYSGSKNFRFHVDLWDDNGVLRGDDYEMPNWLVDVIEDYPRQDLRLEFNCIIEYWEDPGDYETPPASETDIMVDVSLHGQCVKHTFSRYEENEIIELFHDQIEAEGGDLYEW